MARYRVPLHLVTDETHRKLIIAWMDELDVRPVVRDVIMLALDSDYNGRPFPLSSDGISFLADFEVEIYGVKMRHPAGLGHDLLFRGQSLLPWWREGEDNRLWDDQWFREALIDFKRPIWAAIEYRGLRMLGKRYFDGWTKDAPMVKHSLSVGCRHPLKWAGYKPDFNLERKAA